MANLFGGFSPRNAIKQVGSFVNPTGGVSDYDVFTTKGDQRSAVPQSSPSSGTSDGAMYFDAASGQTMQYNNGAWTPVSNGGGAAQGDVTGSSAPAGGGARLPDLNMAAINNTQAALDQLPALLRAALEAESTRRGNILRGFDDQEAGQRKTYDTSTVTNQQNYDANYMDSIRSGIKGLGGLFNILRGTGAAGGTAEDLVRDTVGGVTANDIRMGADTQKGNQLSLDSALSSFLTELKGKRQAADDTFENNNRAIERDNATQMQDLFGKMAGYYGDAGRTGEAATYMAKAGELTPKIAQSSMARQSAYDTTPVAVKAPELSAFSGPTQPNVAMATPDQVGSGIFTMNRKKSEQQTPLALPAGA